jgi:hypothetical protein
MTMSEVSPEKNTPKMGEIDTSSAGSPSSDQTLTHSNYQTDSPQDVEKQSDPETAANLEEKKQSAFKSLGILDRFLALWIFLAMLIGILLGNFVENVGPALQKGKFVGVSVPIGNLPFPTPDHCFTKTSGSNRVACYDVSNPLQSSI